ncbi:MAG TPA: hypothetical protein VNM47_16750 [Terriglobia bacterium]|nr:hypothetical protein [Terriglobia bacterium]
MKTIRSLMILAGLSVALLALGTAGAKAQAFYSTRFVGTFTLPFEAQWGALTLPVGDYTLEYVMQEGGRHLAYVRSTAKGGPHGMILARPARRASATKNELVCIRNGKALIVRALEMPVIGESVSFPLPHGAELVAERLNGSTNTQLAQAPMHIQRIPVEPSEK